MRAVRLVALVALAGAILYLGLVAWNTWRVNTSLNAAVDDARSLRAALATGNQGRVDMALAALQDDSTTARDHADGPTWSSLTHLPVLGDDARGVRLVSDVIHQLSHHGLRPLT